jgi:hypothetical protein
LKSLKIFIRKRIPRLNHPHCAGCKYNSGMAFAVSLPATVSRSNEYIYAP